MYRKVKAEAMRIAMNAVRRALRREGIPLSHVEISAAQKAAKALMKEKPYFYRKAKANLAKA